jgi:DNA-binding response OmpR family regulator
MERRFTILVVDDEETIRKLLKVNLTADGYEVITASSGEEALALMDKREPELVILDIMMPGMDGFQTLNLIRRRSDIPVIMLTARAEELTMRDSLELGADDYVQKPFSLPELSARIRAKRRRTGKA